jgi:hypothetical protein
MCFQNITDENRLCSMNTRNELDLFLQNVMFRRNVQRRKPSKCENHAVRNSRFKYHVLGRDWHVEVCRNAFCFCACCNKEIHEKLMSLKPEGQSPIDMRGKRSSYALPSLRPGTKQRIHTHIHSFLIKESHFLEKPVLCLHTELNVKLMYSLFKQKHPAPPVSYSFCFKYLTRTSTTS